jgi:D-3-phosphoglycerate dehydrogenase
VAEQISDYLMTGAVVNALNMPAVSAEDAQRLRPYMRLAEQVGSFAGQITDGGMRAVTIQYEGAIAELNVRPLTSIVLKALLSPLMDSVNMVNAPVIARERDIAVSETRLDQASDYQTMIRLTVTTDGRSRSVAGTLIGSDKPRIVSIEDVPIEAELTPHMLFTRNLDKPGYIGNLGRTLGDAGINIASLHLGRTAPGEQAMCLVSIDQRIDDVALRRISSLPHVVQATVLSF